MVPDIITRYDKALSKIDNNSQLILNDGFNAAYTNLEREITKRYKELNNGDSLMITRQSLVRLEKLKTVLSEVSPDMGFYFENSFKKLLETVNKNGVTLATELVSAMSDKDIVNTSDISIEAAAFAASNLKDSLMSIYGQLNQKVITLVVSSISQGWGIARLKSAMVKVLQLSKSNAESIARTSVMASFNGAAQQKYLESGITLVRIFATADERSCPTCVARNLNVYKIGDIIVPLHPRCRCFLTPYDESWDTGKGKWESKFYNQVRGGFEGNLNYGLSPSERYAGLTSPAPVYQEFTD